MRLMGDRRFTMVMSAPAKKRLGCAGIQDNAAKVPSLHALRLLSADGSARPLKANLPRALHFCIKVLLHLGQGMGGRPFGLRCHAIASNDQSEVPHEGIIGRIQHTDVRGESRQDQSAGTEMLQKKLQGGREEARVFWFKHEIILLARQKESRQH